MSTLYIVATPIGNLTDMTPRAIEILNTVDLIAAEDTRHSKRLMQHFSINTRMLAYHEHGGEKQSEKLIEALQQGRSIALISDAGTPLISDPGYRIVHRAHQLNIPVVPIPGACALVAALSAAGLATNRFSFEGFMAAKQKARLDHLDSIATDTRTLIFYEAPHRIKATLLDMQQVFGENRLITLARELSKTFETIKQFRIADMVKWVSEDENQQRGEIVLVVEGAQIVEKTELNDASKALLSLLITEMPPKKASKIVAEYCSVPKKAAYDYLLELKN